MSSPVRFEHQREALGIGEAALRLCGTWRPSPAGSRPLAIGDEVFRLVSAQRAQAGKRPVELVRAKGHHVATGFLGPR